MEIWKLEYIESIAGWVCMSVIELFTYKDTEFNSLAPLEPPPKIKKFLNMDEVKGFILSDLS